MAKDESNASSTNYYFLTYVSGKTENSIWESAFLVTSSLQILTETQAIIC